MLVYKDINYFIRQDDVSKDYILVTNYGNVNLGLNYTPEQVNILLDAITLKMQNARYNANSSVTDPLPKDNKIWLYKCKDNSYCRFATKKQENGLRYKQGYINNPKKAIVRSFKVDEREQQTLNGVEILTGHITKRKNRNV